MWQAATLLAMLAMGVTCIVHPSPLHYQPEPGSLLLTDPCNIFHEITQNPIIDSHYYFSKVQDRLNGNIQCHKPLVFNPNVHTLLAVAQDQKIKKEAYRLIIDQRGITIEYADYSGYIYALETFYQIARKSFKHNN